MTVRTKLSQEDFINASFATMISRRYTRIILIVFLCIMTFNIITSLGRSNPVLPTIIPAVIMLTLFAGILYFSIKKAYKNNPVAGETIDYTITPEQLQMVGETYKAELAWSNIPKVTLTGKWLFIWHNSQLAR